MGRFEGRVVIVTGSSSGIGQSALLGFAKEGASVVVHGNNEDRIAATVDLLRQAGVPESKYLVIRGLIQERETIEKLINETIAKFGQLDVLVNNAGVGAKSGIRADSVENFDYVFAVNLRAPFQLIDMAYPHLVKTKGNIVNVSSVTAFRAVANADFVTVYGMSKAALDMLTKTRAPKFAADGVRINSVNPGPFETNIGVERRKALPQEVQINLEENRNKWLEENVPIGRIGNCSELTPVILLLADPTNTYTTGSSWVVDGGLLTNAPKAF